MKKSICFLLSVSFTIYTLIGNTFNLYAQQQMKKTIAVLNLEVREGLSRTAAATLSDRLRTELVNLGVLTVLERGQMYQILQEQGFNQTGCTTSECAIEAGKLLGVQQMIAGDVGKVGDVLTIDVRVFDVETGKIFQAQQIDYEGEISGLLTIMKEIARKISGLEEEKGFPWLWVSLGVVAVGAGVAIILTGEKEPGETELGSLPDPSWPPGN